MSIVKQFEYAQERYSHLKVDVKKALETLSKIKISLHCWQGDDVGGFESAEGLTGGGILATGNYPGKARTPQELRQDAETAFKMIPGKHRFNLHAIYLENGGKKVDRNEIAPEHFRNWVDWAKEQELGLDFNPTYFSHPLAESGFTLSHKDKKIRRFWVQHGICCRKIAEHFGKKLKTPAVVNFWMPDGFKDYPVDRLAARQRMKNSLDEIFAEEISPKHELDAVESKLFGIGSEACVIGSHEFFMGYALEKKKLLCLDSGHFHPTEGIADKFSSISLYMKEFLLHVSRPMRWDSDHVVIWNDDLRAIAEELVRNNLLGRVHIGLDFFDATINRVAAWVIGTRAMLKSLLAALLEPTEVLRILETHDDYTGRLALYEEWKTMPFGAVWEYYCETQGVPFDFSWIGEVKKYERSVMDSR
ncbi:MAG: L-rhamnose isomerase [Planctomycetaceae bacterium]|nr:L-rhamnose isomerase [Planctomycetaceae bacterium]